MTIKDKLAALRELDRLLRRGYINLAKYNTRVQALASM